MPDESVGSPRVPMTCADFAALPSTSADLVVRQIRPVCHPDAPVEVFYCEGILILRCASCLANILHIAVAP
jgi:hypothetical protein